MSSSLISLSDAELSEQDYLFLNFCEQYYFSVGHLPTKVEAANPGGYKGLIFDKCVMNATFNKALQVRGITPYALLDHEGQVPSQLTTRQLHAVSTVLDKVDQKSLKRKLQEIGISNATWNGWCRDPIFNGYLQARGEAALGLNQHEAHFALVERVKTGDLGAIKYFNELTGRYVPERTKGPDINAVILRVIEIIQIYEPNPVIQSQIADALLDVVKESAPIHNSRPLVRAGIKRPEGHVQIGPGYTHPDILDDIIEVKPTEERTDTVEIIVSSRTTEYPGDNPDLLPGIHDEGTDVEEVQQ